MSFFSLPNEVLRFIVEMSYRNGTAPWRHQENNAVFKRSLDLSRITSRLRGIALDTPLLWSLLWNLMHPHALKVCLQRSKEAGLHIHVDEGPHYLYGSRFSRVQDFLDVVSPHILRWKIFRAEFYTLPPVIHFIGLDKGQTLPMLEAIIINRHGEDKLEELPVLRWSTPRLTFVDCKSVFPFPTSYSDSIQWFAFRYPSKPAPWKIPIETLPQVLAPMTALLCDYPAIELMPRILEGSKTDSNWYSAGELLYLPNLSVLSLLLDDTGKFPLLNAGIVKQQLNSTEILRRLRLHSLTTLELKGSLVHSGSQHMDVLREVLSEAPLVQRLILENFPTLDIETLLDASTLPSVQRVKVFLTPIIPGNSFGETGGTSSWTLPPCLRRLTFLDCQMSGSEEEVEAFESALITRLYDKLQKGPSWQILRAVELLQCAVGSVTGQQPRLVPLRCIHGRRSCPKAVIAPLHYLEEPFESDGECGTAQRRYLDGFDDD